MYCETSKVVVCASGRVPQTICSTGSLVGSLTIVALLVLFLGWKADRPYRNSLAPKLTLVLVLYKTVYYKSTVPILQIYWLKFVRISNIRTPQPVQESLMNYNNSSMQNNKIIITKTTLMLRGVNSEYCFTQFKLKFVLYFEF